MTERSILHPLVNAEEANVELRKEHLCFGCCCNMRKSTIAVQIILGIVFAAISLICYASGVYKNWTTDPKVIMDLDDAYRKVAILTAVGILIAFVVIVGAISYNAYLVFLGVVYTVVENVLSIMYVFPVIKDHVDHPYFYIVATTIMGVLIIYPHVFFIYEVKAGILLNPNVDLRAEGQNLFL